jgi:hypothetical protein
MLRLSRRRDGILTLKQEKDHVTKRRWRLPNGRAMLQSEYKKARSASARALRSRNASRPTGNERIR